MSAICRALRNLVIIILSAFALLVGAGIANADPTEQPVKPLDQIFIDTTAKINEQVTAALQSPDPLGGLAGVANGLPAVVIPQPVAPDPNACNGSTNIHDNVACGGANVEEFYDEIGAVQAPPLAAIVPELGFGVWIDPSTGFVCGYMPNMAAHHCDGTSYYGAHSFSQVATTEDDRITIAIHESVHRLQEAQSLNVVGATFEGSAVYPYEQQADCGVGAFYANGERNNTKTSAQVAQARNTIGNLGVEGETSHGDRHQRIAAFNIGYYGGAVACNAFTPGKIVFPVS